MRFWRELWKDVWLGVAVAVDLMSGIASIFREWLSVFHPAAVSSSRLFDACLWTCFVISCGIVITRQRIAIVALEDEARRLRGGRADAERLHKLFGEFMNEGEALALELRRGMEIYGPWTIKRNDWVMRVSKALTDMTLPTEAAASRHAGEKDFIPAPGTVFDRKHQFQLYMDQLTGSRTELQRIVERRLPPI
jgi:hypothetical protein